VKRSQSGPRGRQSGEPFRARLDRELATLEGWQRIWSLRHVVPPEWTQSPHAYSAFFKTYYPELWGAGPPTEEELWQIVYDVPKGRLWGLLWLGRPTHTSGLPVLTSASAPGPPRPALSLLPLTSLTSLTPFTSLTSLTSLTPPAPGPSNVVPFPVRAEAGGQSAAINALIDAHIEACHESRPNVYLRPQDLKTGYLSLKKIAQAQGLRLTAGMVRKRFYSTVHADKRCPVGLPNPPR
jgi:hypothetical protein